MTLAPKIYIVGCGPGSPQHLTQEAISVVESCRVVAGYERLLRLFPRFTGMRIVFGADIQSAMDKLDAARHVGSVAVLVSGDPGCYSLAKIILQKFGQEHCKVIPGISSVQAAFARICLEWADAKIVSAHRSRPDEETEMQLFREPKIAILLGARDSMGWLISFLQKCKHPRRIVICQNLGLEDETVTEVTEAELPRLQVNSRAVVILLAKEHLL